MKSLKVALMISILYLFMTLLFSCAVDPVTDKKQLMFISEGQEIEIGKKYDLHIIEIFGEYQNPALLSFIQN
jgi:hypothetical protein